MKDELQLDAAFSLEGLAGWNASTPEAEAMFRDSGTIHDEVLTGDNRAGVPFLRHMTFDQWIEGIRARRKLGFQRA